MSRDYTGGGRAANPVLLVFVLVAVAAACSSGGLSQATPSPPVVTVAPPTDTSRPTVPGTAPAATTAPATQSPVPPPTASPTPVPPLYPWLATQLRDVRTGEIVVPADLLGKVVVIEPMAIWCSSCRVQQNEVRTALANLDRPDIVYVSLDVDPFETEADLAQYADQRGYPWHFAIASDELARELAATFGDLVLNPPATPKIVVAPDGTAEVSFGIKNAADLEAELAALLP